MEISMIYYLVIICPIAYFLAFIPQRIINLSQIDTKDCNMSYLRIISSLYIAAILICFIPVYNEISLFCLKYFIYFMPILQILLGINTLTALKISRIHTTILQKIIVFLIPIAGLSITYYKYNKIIKARITGILSVIGILYYFAVIIVVIYIASYTFIDNNF